MHLSFEIPDDIYLAINESDDHLKEMAKRKFVLELYKKGKISISQGARILDMNLYSFMKFLSQNGLPAIKDYDIEAELDNLKG